MLETRKWKISRCTRRFS